VFVDDGWVLVAPDPDRPEYYIIASTRDAGHADRLVEEYCSWCGRSWPKRRLRRRPWSRPRIVGLGRAA